MKKKLIALTLAALMVTGLVGCGGREMKEKEKLKKI